MNRESQIVASMMVAWGSGTPLDRGFYVPKDVEVEQITPEGTDLDIRVWEMAGKIRGVAFAGKANRPLWNYAFRDRNQLNQMINKSVEDRKGKMDRMVQRQQERQQFKHAFEVGDILYSSWGYDQTNVDWYQVVESGDKSIKIRAIDSKVSQGSMGSDSVMPMIDHFTGPVMTKIVRPGNSVKMTSYASAYKWDGKPKHQTSFGWGH